MAYNLLYKLNDNINAIRIALQYKQGDALTDEDTMALSKYAGFGGIKAILYPDGDKETWIQNGAKESDLRLYEDIISLHGLLKEHFNEQEYKAVISALQNSVLTAFFTPAVVPQTLYRVLAENNINPQRIYEPSAGAGIFISEAVKAFPKLQQVTAVEKDILTGKILQALSSASEVPTKVHISGLENAPTNDNGKYDLIVSNIPFGNFSVYDSDIPDKLLSGKIHNYFFAKGLDKLANGGLMAYITTDGFLNSPSNLEARKYLFSNADFISLSVMPDNLMKDTGNTEAPSHLLIVQKNEFKNKLSEQEEALLQTTGLTGASGNYHQNSYIFAHPDLITGNETKEGTNQYGQPTLSIWQNGNINDITDKIAVHINNGISLRFNREAFKNTILQFAFETRTEDKRLTFLELPETKKEAVNIQLGLFDIAPAENINRALAYINAADEKIISRQTARLISTIKTTAKPEHESILLLTAKEIKAARYVYKLYSNVAEIKFPDKWMAASDLNAVLKDLAYQLPQYGYDYSYSGDESLKESFGLERRSQLPFEDTRDYYKNGTLVMFNGAIGVLNEINTEQNSAKFVALPHQKEIQFYKEYIKLRDDYFRLFNIEEKDDRETRRELLNEAYDRFITAHGILNLPANAKRILEDQGLGFQLLSSLERNQNGRFVKADVLLQSLDKSQEAFITDNPLEALARCLNDKGHVDLDYICKATSLEEAELIGKLEQHIYLDPVTDEWQTADEYLSGNVVEKLNDAQWNAANAPENIFYQQSLAAIEKAQPEKIPFELLDFNLGERWMPVSYYNHYATALFETETQVEYFKSLDAFKVGVAARNAKINQEYAVTSKGGITVNGISLMEHALENTAPFLTYEVDMGDRKVRVPDNEAIQLAHGKIETIRTGFANWLQELPQAEKETLENLYNNTFNCYVLRKYDGSHLQFPGLDKHALGITDLYSSQKDSAWRIVQNRGALVDHEVGLGKTLTMVIAATEMKRLGTIHKPAILALKANVNQIADTYRKAYPNAKVLAPGPDDFTPAKRKRLFHEIKNNNWDCIILTHDQFGKIPQSPEIQKNIFQQELDNVEADLETAKGAGAEISKKVLKGLQIRKRNLAANLLAVERKIESKKDDGIDFKEMGIDHLFVDESHKFKNLTFTTRHNRVAGLGNTEGSQKALNMLFAVRTLQDKFDADLCVTFLSGTPISNSLTEMYLLFKYLRPKELSKQGIENFDAWAAVFAKKTTDFEFSVTNEIIAKERFRHFIKVPELALFYNEITDYKTAKHISLDKPELEEHLVNITPTPEQARFIKDLMQFAKTGDGRFIGRGKLSPAEDKGRMLLATNYAKKMSADMRLINEFKYDDHPGNKVNICAQKVADIYNNTTEHKGTQIIFCDIGTPKPDQFNIYDALKQKLTEQYGIPATEISFIHDNGWANLTTKPGMFRKMNEGKIRILLGSTEKAGTGLNVQQRIVAMHHLDIPWKPSELEQRGGRGARQGNIVAKEFYGNKVQNFIYAVEQSLDNYKFNLLKNKQHFISQMKNCELHVRSIDEGGIDEQNGMNFSEYIAILSGDTTLLEKSKLEKKVAVMENLRTAHFRQLSRTKYELEHLTREKSSNENILLKLAADGKVYKQLLQHDKEGTKLNPIQLNGFKSVEPEVIGRHLIKLYNKNLRTDEDTLIGSLYGFNLYIHPRDRSYKLGREKIEHYENTFYAQREKDGIRYAYNDGFVNMENPKLAARYFLNAIDRIDNLTTAYQKELATIERDIPMLQTILEKPFEKEEELRAMKGELTKLERAITLNIQANKMKESTDEDLAPEVPEPQLTPLVQINNNYKQGNNSVLILNSDEGGNKRRKRLGL